MTGPVDSPPNKELNCVSANKSELDSLIYLIYFHSVGFNAKIVEKILKKKLLV